MSWNIPYPNLRLYNRDIQQSGIENEDQREVKAVSTKFNNKHGFHFDWLCPCLEFKSQKPSLNVKIN
ncbi:hypothetical protein F9Y85_06080 [Pseudoalteromonas maricaloris]|uniref:Uncharacterized protein n=1 Tax=Pseudoalteromonas maricaloris TaxID=184924 RepID=A0A8I2H048_9GAMM|nr:hypothetical protein [Pseudoalteromonas maricaloris]